MWFKYMDDKFCVAVKYLMLGKDARVDVAHVAATQTWLFQWALLYFDGAGIAFKE